MLESFNTGKFEYKRLTEAEQQQRGILGRLKGIIADTKNSTRNGRKYSSELWGNVFNNDVMKEKIANRCVFGELGHPTDREETDMEKIAICLAEQPKIGDDGKIYGVFDILNTPNGKILKSLCDYGCTIGVSSRGTGDLYTDEDGNEAVDPETYNCECWDAVLVPAVKEARMQYVSESLEKKRYNKSLRTVLQESLDKASEDDKKIMKEALDDLGIELEEASEEQIEEPIKEDTLEYKNDDRDFNLVKNNAIKAAKRDGYDQIITFDPDGSYTIHRDYPGNNFEGEIIGRVKCNGSDYSYIEEAIHPELKDKKPIKGDEPFTVKVDPDAVKKVFEIIDSMSEEDHNLLLDNYFDAYAPLKKDDTYKNAKVIVNKLLRKYHLPAWALEAYAENWDEEHSWDHWGEQVEESLLTDLEDAGEWFKDEYGEEAYGAYAKFAEENPEVYDNLYGEENIKKFFDQYNKDERLISTLRDSQEVEEPIEEECIDESCADKEDAEEVVNDKSSELVAELQEALLKIKELEDDNLSLQERLSVCNAKENELTEQLNKYKQATITLSDSAKQVKSLNEDKTKLEEDLSKKAQIASFNKARVDSLIETKKDLTSKLTEANNKVTELEGQVKVINEELENKSKQLDSSKSTIEKYRKNYAALKEDFIEAKAANYGLTKNEVKNNLNESFNLNELDSVCKEMSAEKNRLSKLPFVINENTNFSVKKSKNEYIMNESLASTADDYISDSLLQLANLK